MLVVQLHSTLKEIQFFCILLGTLFIHFGAYLLAFHFLIKIELSKEKK